MSGGGTHGLAQIIENVVIGKADNNKHNLLWFIRVLLVFCFCTFAWVFFVAKSIPDAIYVIGHMLDGISHPVAYLKDGFKSIGFTRTNLVVSIFSLALLLVYDYLSLTKDVINMITNKSLVLRWSLYIFFMLLIVFLSEKGVAAEFVYFQF